MKKAIAAVSIILCAILMIVLLISEVPDLFDYDFRNINYDPNDTAVPEKLPELELTPVTEKASIWERIKEMNGESSEEQEETATVKETEEPAESEQPVTTKKKKSMLEILGENQPEVTEVPEEETGMPVVIP